MLDRSKIGMEFPAFTADVEKGRLKFFAKAIGETNPVYLNESAARDAGYKTLPAPPTFPMVLDMESPDCLPILRELKMDIGKILHGSQSFEYHDTIYAGDTITVTSKLKNIFDKKGGTMEFVELENRYVNQEGVQVATAVQSLVYRNA